VPFGASEFEALVAFAGKYGQRVVQAPGAAPGMVTRASVVSSFIPWSTPLEGMEDYPYTDAHGLVTTGLGNLIDAFQEGQKAGVNCGHGTNTPCGSATPVASARALPWSPNNLDADWAALKARWPAVQSVACRGITTSRLSQDAVRRLVLSKMRDNEAFILRGLPGFGRAPADAQLAVHSMSWAQGPGFTSSWPAFRDAFNRGDYAAAAAESHMKGYGIDMRNLADRLLLLNAAAVKATGADPDRLYYLDGLTRLLGAQRTTPARTAVFLAALAALGVGLYVAAKD
jgi:GH24 family phage-related lysozyme (muramidase)